jgi:phosphoadenosine phosphosulfate reductase
LTTVLQFSGGKDSLACLYLNRHRWPDITVLWCSPAEPLPEIEAYMRRVATMVPRFIVLRSAQSIPEFGYPADVVPAASTQLGNLVGGATRYKFQSRYDCCGRSLWAPLHAATIALGATTIIRGQKDADRLKGPLRDGEVSDGIRYEYPLAGWTDAEVYAYLRSVDAELPPTYESMATSFDCWNCTAYLEENPTKLAYLRAKHPEKAEHVFAVLQDLRAAIRAAASPLEAVIGE